MDIDIHRVIEPRHTPRSPKISTKSCLTTSCLERVWALFEGVGCMGVGSMGPMSSWDVLMSDGPDVQPVMGIACSRVTLTHVGTSGCRNLCWYIRCLIGILLHIRLIQ